MKAMRLRQWFGKKAVVRYEGESLTLPVCQFAQRRVADDID